MLSRRKITTRAHAVEGTKSNGKFQTKWDARRLLSSGSLAIMSAPNFSPREPLPLNHALALIIGVSVVVITTVLNWASNNALFTITQVLVISGIGGALSFALWGGRRRWLIGCLLGFIAGMGAAGAFLIYTRWYRPEMKTMWDIEVCLTFAAGGGLPTAIMGLILAADKPDSK